MTDEDILRLYNPLHDGFSNAEFVKDGVPLLAHYTSIQVLESILRTNQLWFSNPLFMNDLQEMRFGLNEGFQQFAKPEVTDQAGGDGRRAALLQHAFAHFFQSYDNTEAFDTYIFGLSEHVRGDSDGRLSMWRGYGRHESGVALVFNPAAVTEVPESPLIISKVRYATDQERLDQLGKILNRWSSITAAANLPEDKLYLASHAALQAIKTFALITKHKGFDEEAEWRVIYYPDRDRSGLLKKCLTYHVGARGVEPVLKYELGYIAGVSAPDLALDKILDSVILGPSVSSSLAQKSVERMLESIGKPQFKAKVKPSRIPLRPGSGGSF